MTKAEKQKSGLSRWPRDEPRMLKTCKSVSYNITMNKPSGCQGTGICCLAVKGPKGRRDEPPQSLPKRQLREPQAMNFKMPKSDTIKRIRSRANSIRTCEHVDREAVSEQSSEEETNERGLRGCHRRSVEHLHETKYQGS